MKLKDSKETVRALSTMLTKMNRRKKTWFDNGTEFAEEFKKFCVSQRRQIYPIMNETYAFFAERTIRSMENFLYRYMENNAYKYIHKLPQFVTTLSSRKDCSVVSKTKRWQKLQLFVHSLQQTSRRLQKTKK